MADGCNCIVPNPRDGKNAGARFYRGNGLVLRLEGDDTMAFQVEDDNRWHAMFSFWALFIVGNPVLPIRKVRLQFRFSVVGELILMSITDEPYFGFADFHSKLSWPRKRSRQEKKQSHMSRLLKNSLLLEPDVKEIIPKIHPRCAQLLREVD